MSRPVSLFDDRFPVHAFRAAQVRELDRRAIAGGIPGFGLMHRAGCAAWTLLQALWPQAMRIDVVCGTGNNGGDGSVIAALAQQAGRTVRLRVAGDMAAITGDAATALTLAREAGVDVRPFSSDSPLEADLIVDALLGIGLTQAPRPTHAEAIAAINASGRPVFAIDVPSGLDADTGHAPGAVVRADATICFIGVKQGLLTGRAPALCGALWFDDLAVSPQVLATEVPSIMRVTAQAVRPWLRPRARDAHKGHFGHVLVVGGNHGMGGAVMMAAEAAARCGAGLVSVATRPEHVSPLLARRPEIMVHALDDAAGLALLLERASVVICGPGLGRDAWSHRLLGQVLACGLPQVLDADALSLLAMRDTPLPSIPRVITPHPGEAARLLASDTATVQADRFAAACVLARRYDSVCVLKGAGSLIATPGGACQVSSTGNPGMATGGMGDVLSGVVGALLAQGIPPGEAAASAVWLHGAAADDAAEGGERGLLASDLFDALRRQVNGGGR